MIFSHLILMVIHKAYARFTFAHAYSKPVCERDPDVASAWIIDLLNDPEPKMIARFGSTELVCLENTYGMRNSKASIFGYVKGMCLPWWRNENIAEQMQKWSGFFPITNDALERFYDVMLKDISLVDLLGSWLPQERLFAKELGTSKKVDLELLNPYFSKIPWTHALAGKKVLVIHPFASTIESQYLKKDQIFPNGLLPDFELKTIKAVQSLGGEKTPYETWFDALDAMKYAMDAIDYDIALIGCGAYGFPLAAHAKRRGKKGFHIGGSLQLLFGIRGKRWENPDYNPVYDFSKLMNEYWVKPGETERPKNADKVEGACYW